MGSATIQAHQTHSIETLFLGRASKSTQGKLVHAYRLNGQDLEELGVRLMKHCQCLFSAIFRSLDSTELQPFTTKHNSFTVRFQLKNSSAARALVRVAEAASLIPFLPSTQ